MRYPSLNPEYLGILSPWVLQKRLPVPLQVITLVVRTSILRLTGQAVTSHRHQVTHLIISQLVVTNQNTGEGEVPLPLVTRISLRPSLPRSTGQTVTMAALLVIMAVTR